MSTSNKITMGKDGKEYVTQHITHERCDMLEQGGFCGRIIRVEASLVKGLSKNFNERDLVMFGIPYRVVRKGEIIR